MTFVSSPSPTLDNNSNLNQPPADAPPYMIDFFAGRDRLLEEIDNRKRSETKHQLRRAPFPCKLSVELFDPLEDWLCSLISAAVLVSVPWGFSPCQTSRCRERTYRDRSQIRTPNRYL
jgi:hypothetical protein